MQERTILNLKRYGVAVLSAALATIARVSLNPWLQSRTTFITYILAIIITAWYGGLWPALVAVGLGAIISIYLFIPPQNSLRISNSGDLFSLTLYILVGMAIAILSEVLHRATRKAREAARALAEQRELLRVTLSSIGDGVITTDTEGRITFMNPVAERLTGWSRDEAKGAQLSEVFKVINENTREPVESPVTKALKEGAIIGLASYSLLITKSGDEISIDESGAPIKNDRGQIEGVVLVFHDITKRRRAERAVQVWQQVFNHASWGVVIANPIEGTLEAVNPAYARMHGYTVEEMRGMPLIQAIAPEARIDWDEKVRVTHEQGYNIYESIHIRKDGTRFPVLMDIAVIKDEEGRILYRAANLQDITERKRAEAALIESEERYRELFENANDIIYTLDLEGNLTSLNKAGERITGYRREDILNTPIAAIVAPEYMETMIQMFDRKVEGENLTAYELEISAKDARRLTLEVSSRLVFRDGKPIGVQGIARDITERKLAEEERARLYNEAREAVLAREEALLLRDELLKREQSARSEAEAANRAKDEFLATVSHELRTPLNAILGWSHMLRNSKLDEATAARALETVERNAKSQAQLVEDILDVSRIITGNLRLDVRPAELQLVIESAIDSVRPAIEAKGIRLESVLDPRAGPVPGDPSRLQQVVWNLLSNAVKFTDRGGRVQIRLERVNSHVEITVSDSGRGIRTDFLAHVFDRFRQADSTSTRQHGGLGLGLAIVRHLVEMHGGTVEAFSPGEGLGATFTVKLPLMIVHTDWRLEERVHPTAATGARFEQSSMLNGLRLLVVDDEGDTRELLALMLSEFGAEVKTCGTAIEALEMLEQIKPDVLISDIEMPGEDGYTFIKQVRKLDAEQARNTPAVALTAYARVEDRMRALAAGFQMHVAKPVEPAELAVVIASLVDRTGRSSGA